LSTRTLWIILQIASSQELLESGSGRMSVDMTIIFMAGFDLFWRAGEAVRANKLRQD
jgi:hypothetical protein